MKFGNEEIHGRNQLYSFPRLPGDSDKYKAETDSLLTQKKGKLGDVASVHQHKVENRGKSTGKGVKRLEFCCGLCH